jgi:hypothetical protein
MTMAEAIKDGHTGALAAQDILNTLQSDFNSPDTTTTRKK